MDCRTTGSIESDIDSPENGSDDSNTSLAMPFGVASDGSSSDVEKPMMAAHRPLLRCAVGPYDPETLSDLQNSAPSENEQNLTTTEKKTTVILKNLPPSFSRDIMVELLHSHGFRYTLDFVYFPVNFRKNENFSRGFVFLNFSSAESAAQCKVKFDGFADWGVQTDKICETYYSEMHQGLDAQIQLYRDAAVMHPDIGDEFKPAIFENGVRIAFPPPTKPIRGKRLRGRSDVVSS
jgi:hypothetical protein